jgi:hypothetical protein
MSEVMRIAMNEVQATGILPQNARSSRRLPGRARSRAASALEAARSVEESGMHSSGRPAPQCDFRKRYGDEIADIVDEHSTQGGRRAHGPASQDVKAALQAIIADPDAADLQRVDSLTRALLMEPAWRRLRIQTLCALTGQQLGECAQYALDHFPAFRKPLVERAELMMALALLAAASAWHAARRNKLLRDALALVFHADYRHATAIIKKAHRELRAGT